MSRPSPEAAILRRTRLRLIGWSAGSTLVILVILGVAIYGAAASSLAAEGTRQLRDRLEQMAAPGTSITMATGTTPAGSASSTGGIVVTGDPAKPGVVIGGKSSGTIGVVTTMTQTGGATLDMTGVALSAAAPLMLDQTVLARVAAGEQVVLETTMDGTPIRVVAAIVAADGLPSGSGTTGVGTVVAAPPGQLATGTAISGVGTGSSGTGAAAPPGQLATGTGSPGTMALGLVIGDRTAELDTLRTLLVVLLGGGLLVLVASVLVGYAYAGRALVPIREALRRQREFAADASHELRTPLAITRAAVAAARLAEADPVERQRALDDLDAGVARMESLVDDLLLLARADAGAGELVAADTDLALAVAEATEQLETFAATRGVRLALSVQPAPVRGDERRLRQVAAILVDNAIRHSPSGGRVTVTVGPGAVLTVEDEGPGVAPEDSEHVFERFWRAPGAPAGGTGLGLAIARWIVERHGGTISADRQQVGMGARFTVWLPAG